MHLIVPGWNKLLLFYNVSMIVMAGHGHPVMFGAGGLLFLFVIFL